MQGVLAWKRMGLAKSFRQWRAITETEAQKARAEQALRYLRQQGLGKAYNQWVAVMQAAAQEAKASKAIRYLKASQGLGRGWLQW